MYQARLRMMRKTRQRMRREMIAIRRERFAAAAAMRLMRKRLRTMQRTFTRGIVAEGFGHTTMFMPSMGLIDGAKQEVNIKINEEGLQRLQMVVTFPYCGSKCLWDPTIEMNEDATLVPTPPPEGANSAAIFGWKSKMKVDAKHVHKMASTVANVLRMLPAYLITVAASNPPANWRPTSAHVLTWKP